MKRFLLIGALLLGGCIGEQGKECFSNNTCEPGLWCVATKGVQQVNTRCVKPGDVWIYVADIRENSGTAAVFAGKDMR